ncbi:MAG: hypothetical protein EOP00_30860 [Pedobacter sp.]|nr:MAG: hypothetical protein EOP00_30860 [Pedobacter sp.]
MKKLLIILLLISSINQLSAQDIRYFINHQETIPNSLDFLDPEQIDSIKLFTPENIKPYLKTNLKQTDKAIVVFMKKGAAVLTLTQLLKEFSINQNAINFSILATSTATYIEEYPITKQILVSKEVIDGLSVIRNPIDDGRFLVIARKATHGESPMQQQIKSITARIHESLPK